MNTPSVNQQTVSESSIFEMAYDKEILQDNLKYDLKRTKNSLFIIAVVLLLSDILGLSMANALNGTTFVYVLVVPIIFVALGFAASVKPMIAMSVAAVLFVLIIAYNIYVLGARSIVSGLIVKAVLVYFFIKGFNHAKDAETAKRDLSSFNR
jgi:hypothetical protein